MRLGMPVPISYFVGEPQDFLLDLPDPILISAAAGASTAEVADGGHPPNDFRAAKLCEFPVPDMVVGLTLRRYGRLRLPSSFPSGKESQPPLPQRSQTRATIA